MQKRVHLPVTSDEPRQSSIAADGRRKYVYTADVTGRFARLRKFVFAGLIAVWVALPLVTIGGRPLVLLDVERRRFFLFGATFNAQDAWLSFFAVTAVGFVLALSTALWGRVFCGFACPQTVFLDGVFRPIERLVEGPREQRIRRDRAPWSLEKVRKKVTKHALYLLASFVIAHILLSFFVPLSTTLRMVVGSPSEHPAAFAWAAVVTLATYLNYAFFREQICLVVCPYGRLQASLVDEDSLVVGYDVRRGEPRGKLKAEGRGDCIDCKRCVVVCPTGIDIRNGLQLDCIGCTACIDACDDVMDKVGREKGLIRYDAQRAFAGAGPRRFWRPRLAVYAVLGIVGLVATTIAITRRTSFEANVVRASGVPYVIEDGEVRNSFVVHLVNKRDEPATFLIAAEGVRLAGAPPSVDVGAMSDARVPIVVTTPSDAPIARWHLVVERVGDGEVLRVSATLARPRS
ncbi:MAG: cytochrome c oxidase accessory protein CcoG [Polyangiaceae bacterium]|nr:cytochrome c oxidase accessory protein CcoG [Polyangiaceae bacterium]